MWGRGVGVCVGEGGLMSECVGGCEYGWRDCCEECTHGHIHALKCILEISVLPFFMAI